MTATFSRFGNDLHAGRRTVPIVRRRRTWYLFSLIAIIVLGGLAGLRGPNLGIEFTGGSEFQIAGVADTDQVAARDTVRDHLPDNEPKVTVLGRDTMRVQTEQLDSAETAALAEELAAAYDVPTDSVSTSYVGPVWSGDITQKMLRAVVVFLVLVAATMALYFRNLKSSLAAMGALVHDMLITAAVYGVVGFEITPGTVIGFLTVMGYSLYDTIVVFDKVRENVEGLTGQTRASFADQVELAANQTLVRSINTSVVALLPVGSILVIGAFLLGAGTLKDISLALFIGIIAGTYSSIFLAPGFLVDLRRKERDIAEHTETVRAARRRGDSSGTAGDRQVDRSDEGAPRSAAGAHAAGSTSVSASGSTQMSASASTSEDGTENRSVDLLEESSGDPAAEHSELVSDQDDHAALPVRDTSRQPRRRPRRRRPTSGGASR